jgi:hypothetical protein
MLSKDERPSERDVMGRKAGDFGVRDVPRNFGYDEGRPHH